MKYNKLLKPFFISLIMLCFYITNIVRADDSIFDNGFEEGSGNWKTNNSNITFNIVTDPVFEGTQSASIASTSTGSFGIEHVVNSIQENTDYLVSGRIKTIETAPAKAFIRIAWYESTDGSGSQIKTEDSEIIASVTDWKILSFVAKAPSPAHSAKIRLIVSSGTAYFDNITVELNISPTEEIHITSTEIIIPTPTEIVDPSYNNIYISEVMVYPDTGQTEWIELYNENDFEVTLSNWYVDDIENAGSSPKKFTMTIAANAFGVLDISTAMFNNDSDYVRLLDFEEIVKDSLSYTSSQKNYSLGRNNFANSTICFQNTSKNASNYNCANIVPTAVIAAVSPTKKAVEPTIRKTPSPTPGSRKLRPTLETKKQYSPIAVETKMKQSATENILGAATEILIDPPDTSPLIHTLTILAFSYSILSIISIITKITIKKGIAAP